MLPDVSALFLIPVFQKSRPARDNCMKTVLVMLFSVLNIIRHCSSSSQFLFSSVWHVNNRLFMRSSEKCHQKMQSKALHFFHIIPCKKEAWDGGLCLSKAEMFEITDGCIETLWFLLLLQQCQPWQGFEITWSLRSPQTLNIPWLHDLRDPEVYDSG